MIANGLVMLAASIALLGDDNGRHQSFFASEPMAFAAQIELMLTDNSEDNCWNNFSQINLRARNLLEAADIPVVSFSESQIPTIDHPYFKLQSKRSG
jgi:hypothetical protein